MKARLVVFPLKGRNWCFSRSLDPTLHSGGPSSPPLTLKDLWRRVASHGLPAKERAEIVADFVADKMNRTWTGLEKAPPGTVKAKIHSLGLRLLSGVKPSEIFLKSLSDDIKKVEIAYPASLNPRLVRRRLRHVAVRGSTTHRKYFYGSVSLLPITTAFSVLPLPNIPFFWILFRAYSHWRAMKGSERLLLLVSDCSNSWGLLVGRENKNDCKSDSKRTPENVPHPPWVLQPSKDLERLLVNEDMKSGVSNCTIATICKSFNLEKKAVLKYKDIKCH